MTKSIDDILRTLRHDVSPNESACAAPERALWRAIIVQALMDASSQSQKPDAIYSKHEALFWLEGTSLDFVMVCECAGYNPSYIRRMAKRALLNGCKWRASPGEGRQRGKRKLRETMPEDEFQGQAVILAFPIARRA